MTRLSPVERQIAQTMSGPVPTLKEARALRAEIRARHGFKEAYMPLLSAPDEISKLDKSERPSYGVSLAPHRSGGFGNLCPRSTPECRADCVAFAGNGGFDSVKDGRAAKVELLVNHGAHFRVLLLEEIRRAVARERLRYSLAGKDFPGIAVRLNAFSDIRWEELPIAADFAELVDVVQFYDYTKWAQAERPLPSWYHLTRSYIPGKSTLADDSPNAVVASMSVQNRTVQPAIAEGRFRLDLDTGDRPIVSGDLSDERFLDEPGSIVVLTRKGSLRKDSPFVVQSWVEQAEVAMV